MFRFIYIYRRLSGHKVCQEKSSDSGELSITCLLKATMTFNTSNHRVKSYPSLKSISSIMYICICSMNPFYHCDLPTHVKHTVL